MISLYSMRTMYRWAPAIKQVPFRRYTGKIVQRIIFCRAVFPFSFHMRLRFSAQFVIVTMLLPMPTRISKCRHGHFMRHELPACPDARLAPAHSNLRSVSAEFQMSTMLLSVLILTDSCTAIPETKQCTEHGRHSDLLRHAAESYPEVPETGVAFAEAFCYLSYPPFGNNIDCPYGIVLC